MNLGGIQPFTTIDYPSKLSAVFFTKGCSLRCPYCQNPMLQSVEGGSVLDWKVAQDFMKSRVRLLDAIVFSGGEPLIQADLFDAMKEAKDLGYLVGLHTSGVSSKALQKVIDIVDWVGLDIKTLLDKYEERIPFSKSEEVRKCLNIVINSNKSYEVRTTLDPRVIKYEELFELAKFLSEKGVGTYAVQEYHTFPGEENPPKKEEVVKYFNKELLDSIKGLFNSFEVRRS